MDGEFIATSQKSKQESGGNDRFAELKRSANHPAMFLITEIPRMDAVMSVILPPFGFLCKAKPLLLR
jgi:hypothetical protein